ncbi:uncharacterized protein LOC124367173 [Homalodisca vitripennis]|uniref:uncharacterized protein LOC124367173 n=1 Tax=Homalodisca vitripennis TaxID=197043 RepID=UPI001EEC2406|nr:uncharacterized protein LOC124367173 [Homalodisca vitripennis]
MAVVTVENRAIVEKTNKWEGINGTAFEADPSKNEGKTDRFFPSWDFRTRGGTLLGVRNRLQYLHCCIQLSKLFILLAILYNLVFSVDTRYSLRTKIKRTFSEKQTKSWRYITLTLP